MQDKQISIWFFIGALHFIYGVLIVVSGILNYGSPDTRVVLSHLHADVWWGAVLLLMGGTYCLLHRPGKK